jgi:hypothetical protein
MPYIENVYHKEVTHIGFLDTKENRKPSLDGPGISVTTHPESWRSLRGLNGPELNLIFPTGQWVDAMTFSDQDFLEMRDWAVQQGYLRQVQAWWALVEREGDMMPRPFMSRVEAARAVDRTLQAEEEAAERGEGATWQEETYKITPRGLKRLERWPGALEQYEQATIILYVRQVVVPKRPYVVGVWWSEPDNVDAGCSPSGVLFPERLHHFEVEDEEGDVMGFTEKFPDFEAPVDPLVEYA